MKVLIVDDEELDLFIHKKLLGLEFETAGFTSVEDTLAWAKTNDFDVAIIDYYLGAGIHANQLLKQLITLRGATFKAFVISNYVNEEQVIDLRAAGFSDVIYKPLTLEVFRTKLGA